MREGGQPTVLVADDELMIRKTYEVWLEQRYNSRMAADGHEVLTAMDDTVDAVILDRLMPGFSGDEALTELRDRGYGCPVGMVTAVDPDLDIIELPFQAYQTKPVSRDSFLKMVDQLLILGEYEAAMRKLIGLSEKRAALETELSETDLQASEEYQTLRGKYRDASAETSERMEDLEEDTFVNVFAGFD